MELLDRYLSAVRANLPNDQADDIVAEIADDIQSQADEREAMVHRPLTRDEEAGLLKAYGHPRVVAARYAKVQYLIGPELLPFYWYSIKIILTIVIALELFGGLVASIVVSDAAAMYRSLGFAWNSIFVVVGIVTVIFAIVERVPSKVSPLDRIGITKWNPQTLPAAESAQVPRLTSFVDAFANILFALVLLGAGGYRENILTLFLGSAHPQLPFHFTNAWLPLYITLLVSSFAIATSGILTFLAPHRMAFRRSGVVVTNILVIIGAVLTLNGGALFVPSEPILNTMGVWALYCGIAIATLNAAFNGWRLLHERSAQLSGRPA